MLDTIRRLLAAGMIIVAVIGLLPLIPIVFGYVQANVRQDSAATYYPAASSAPTLKFVDCVQQPSPLELDRQGNKTKNVTYYIKCTNRWASPVSIRVSVTDANGTGLSWTNATYSTSADVGPGATACILVGRTSGSANLTGNNPAGTVTVAYRAEINPTQPTYDLGGSVDFTGQLRFSAAPPTQTISCP